MKKHLLTAVLLLFLVCVGWECASACNLKITPADFTAGAGEIVLFRLERYQTHRQCVLPLEDTSIIITGGELVDPGVWQKGNPDVLNFKVKFSEPGPVTVRIERNCPKSGLNFVESKGIVNSAQGATTTGTGLQSPPATGSAPDPAGTGGGLEKQTGALPEVASPTTEPHDVSSVTATVPQDAGEQASTPGEEETGRPTGALPEVASPTTEPHDASSVTATVPQDAGVQAPTPGEEETGPPSGAEPAFWWSINLRLWYAFFLTGLLLFLFKLGQLRKPLLFLSIIILGFYLGACPEPVGALFYILTGTKTGTAVVLLIIPIIISLIWGRVFCGWTCPLGAVQEFIYSERIGVQLPILPDKVLKYLKFIILAVFGYLTWHVGRNMWCSYEPFEVLFNFTGSPLTISILALTLLLSICIERPFCRYICPLGAVFAITSRIARFKMKAQAGACTGCGACTKGNCPVGAIATLDSVTNLPVVDNSECIKCLCCTDLCRRSALQVTNSTQQGKETAEETAGPFLPGRQ